MKAFNKLYEAGMVKRYHTAPTIRTQDLAAHSWGVAMIVLQIVDYAPGPHLLLAALTHDLAECETGDLPAPAKWSNQGLSEALDAMELAFDKRHGIIVDLDDTELEILRWADTFELVLFALQELRMGNKSMTGIYRRGAIHLKQMGFPTQKASDLYFQCVQSEEE